MQGRPEIPPLQASGPGVGRKVQEVDGAMIAPIPHAGQWSWLRRRADNHTQQKGVK